MLCNPLTWESRSRSRDELSSIMAVEKDWSLPNIAFSRESQLLPTPSYWPCVLFPMGEADLKQEARISTGELCWCAWAFQDSRMWRVTCCIWHVCAFWPAHKSSKSICRHKSSKTCRHMYSPVTCTCNTHVHVCTHRHTCQSTIHVYSPEKQSKQADLLHVTLYSSTSLSRLFNHNLYLKSFIVQIVEKWHCISPSDTDWVSRGSIIFT